MYPVVLTGEGESVVVILFIVVLLRDIVDVLSLVPSDKTVSCSVGTVILSGLV